MCHAVITHTAAVVVIRARPHPLTTLPPPPTSAVAPLPSAVAVAVASLASLHGRSSPRRRRRLGSRTLLQTLASSRGARQEVAVGGTTVCGRGGAVTNVAEPVALGHVLQGRCTAEAVAQNKTTNAHGVGGTCRQHTMHGESSQVGAGTHGSGTGGATHMQPNKVALKRTPAPLMHSRVAPRVANVAQQHDVFTVCQATHNAARCRCSIVCVFRGKRVHVCDSVLHHKSVHIHHLVDAIKPALAQRAPVCMCVYVCASPLGMGFPLGYTLAAARRPRNSDAARTRGARHVRIVDTGP